MHISLYDPDADETAVFAKCRIAQSVSHEIDNATARVIASWYASGDTAQQAFVSTGAIVDDRLWRLLTDDGALYDAAPTESHKLALDMLGTYLLNRSDRGPIAGWSTLWVR